ncbi:MAG: quinolinate synthase NadA [Candidatus Thermoplasmatota archaeon]|nr:quinolinate synthase NadA [Candidatus Thermoplasmatota archaeon]
MQTATERIQRLKEKQKAVILAHNYQRPEIQDIADFVGDSLGLAQQATETDARVIVFCGVDFMAESAKILNPDKTVLHPDTGAKCPMAAMVDPESLRRLKEKKGLDVVSYVNTTAAVKAVSDICCTSANAVKVVENMPDGVIFVPDSNLGRYVQRFTDREVVLWPGFCPTHEGITPEDIRHLQQQHPEAQVLAHPECSPEVIDLADKVASTTGMLRYAQQSEGREFIVATEKELAYRMKKEAPGKRFYVVEQAVCPTMKKITLQKVAAALESMQPEVSLDPEVIEQARWPLERMMEIGR